MLVVSLCEIELLSKSIHDACDQGLALDNGETGHYPNFDRSHTPGLNNIQECTFKNTTIHMSPPPRTSSAYTTLAGEGPRRLDKRDRSNWGCATTVLSALGERA